MTDATREFHDITSHPLVQLSYQLKRIVDYIGGKASYFILPLIAFTMIDVFGRKLTNTAFDFQLFLVENVTKYAQSTMLQELEWHMHTILFSLVLGYGFTHNRHVRVDLLRMHMATRAQAIIEFFGTMLFMIPYTIVVIYFCYIFTYDAWVTNEISASLSLIHI